MPLSAERIAELVASHTTNGVIITDRDGLTTWVNEETERLTGYARSELIGRKPGEMLQGRDTSAESVEGMRHALGKRESFETTLVNYSKDGLLYWVRISCRPFYGADGELEGFISTQVDVTRLRRLSDFNTLRANLNQAIADSTDDLSLFQAVCDLAVRYAHLELAWIGRPDEYDHFLYLARAGKAVSYLDGFMISSDPDIPEGQGPSGKTWRTGTAHYSQSFGNNPALKPWQMRARGFGLDANATLPIFRNGAATAIFVVYHARSGIFDDELSAVLDAVAADISHGLDQIDLRTRERELAKQLFEEKELAQITLASIEDAVLTTDAEGRITFVNEKARLLTGWTQEEALGLPFNRVLQITDETNPRMHQDLVHEVLKNRFAINLDNKVVLVARSGATRHIESSAAPIFSPDHALRGCVVIFRDVTERYEANERLEWQANHDALTGLPNRFSLGKYLDSLIARSQPSTTSLAVCVLDLDDFKPVNDQYGHDTGDLVLKELAERMQARMRDGDCLARLAGDELVVVIGNLDTQVSDEELDAIFSRLHEAVEQPFVLGPEEEIFLGMSMGVAVYPKDGEDVDQLIRQADAAMYTAKSNKYNRTSWWRSSMLSLTSRAKEETIDPYGAVASDLLGKAAKLWGGLGQEFSDAFYAGLEQKFDAARILRQMTAEELERLKKRQSEHLERLLSPDLTQDGHRELSVAVGEIHTQIGVEGNEIMSAMEDYGRLLRYASQKLPWRVDARLALDSIMHSRLAAENQFQSEGRKRIEHARIANITHLEARLSDWIAEGELGLRLAQHLSGISCICGVLIGRPDDQDQFVIEFKAGNRADSIHELGEPSDDLVNLGKPIQRMWQSAWLSGQIIVRERYYDELNTSPETNLIRSAAYIPILDSRGKSIRLIALLGKYPGQFAQPLMRMWIESIQHIITPAFLRVERGSPAPIDTLNRQRYHKLLFDDHLQMVVHPIVRLSTGHVEKVEMLARLRDGDRLLSPAAFLPSFGKQDLQALFRKGLRQTLDWLEAWDRQGLSLSANLNLPLSVLISPDCSRWVAEELEAHSIVPQRIYLELLETEDDTEVTTIRDDAIAHLAAMGVRLVMDDLGSGYSSLKRMRTLPFHTVKIDQELVRSAPSEPERTVPFIGSLIRMAQSVGFAVVVEGLETLDMVDMASHLGAEYGQGYAFTKPILPEHLPAWIRDWQSSSMLTQLDTLLGKHALAYLTFTA